MVPNFYAQFQEDAWIYTHLDLPKIGVYVDLGANDPFLYNNTAFLREMGWDGVSVDGLDFSVEYDRVGARFLNEVVSDKPEVPFFTGCNPSLARICDRGTMVETVTLTEIVSYYSFEQVDLLSLDMEGGEYDAIMSGQWIVPPKIIISEFLTASLDGGPDVRDDRVEEYLLSRGYSKVWSSCSNNIFLRK